MNTHTHIQSSVGLDLGLGFKDIPHTAGLNAQIREDLCLYTGFVNVSDIYELVSTLGV